MSSNLDILFNLLMTEWARREEKTPPPEIINHIYNYVFKPMLDVRALLDKEILDDIIKRVTHDIHSGHGTFGMHHLAVLEKIRKGGFEP